MQKAPDAFRTISEVAGELEVPQHVLRFWETRFSQIRPMKRAGGRRYYRPQDVDLLRGIRQLLYEEGYTIKGVQKILREHGIAHVIAIGQGEIAAGPAVRINMAAMAQTRAADTSGRARAAMAEDDAADGGDGEAQRMSTTSPRASALNGEAVVALREALAELEQAVTLLKSAAVPSDDEVAA